MALSQRLLCLLLISSSAFAAPYQWDLPKGFSQPLVPADNPMSTDKVTLGRKLFFDTNLSINNTYSCASCHHRAYAFTDQFGQAVGATGEILARGTMSLMNVAYNISYGWQANGANSLESQMREPLFNQHPVELGLKGREQAILAQLLQNSDYRQAFSLSFSLADQQLETELEFEHIIKAIAAFERTLISGNSAFDRYVFAAQHNALSSTAKRGMDLFFSDKAGCANCHFGINFSGNWRDMNGDIGEATSAHNGTGTQLMRVPSLRNIGVTSPYMHDGRFATLSQVIQHYSTLEVRKEINSGLVELSQEEQSWLIDFLFSLTDADFIDQQ